MATTTVERLSQPPSHDQLSSTQQQLLTFEYFVVLYDVHMFNHGYIWLSSFPRYC